MTRKSHHSPSSIPPATAGPSMAAMTGLSSSSREGPSGPRGISPPLPRGRDIELAQRMVGIERAHVFEIPARPKRAARAIENRDAGILIGIEFKKGGGQRIRAFGVHGVAGFGPVVNHGPYRSILLNSDCHLGYPPHDQPLDKRLAGDDSKAVTGSSAPQ